MKEHVIRLRLPAFVYKKFKVICAENDLSMPKLNAQLIRNFIEIDDMNKNMTNHLRK